VPTDDAAALIALALREKGIKVTEQFWMTPSEPHRKVLGLVSPDRDAPDGYALYGKIFAALKGFPYADPACIGTATYTDPAFIGTRMMVFGEESLRRELDMIHAGFTKLSEIGPYEDVEIAPIPPAEDIRKSGELHFISDGWPDEAGLRCTAVFASFGGSGARPFREIEGEAELFEVFEAFQLRSMDRNRILEALKQGRSDSAFVRDIGLDALYRESLA